MKRARLVLPLVLACLAAGIGGCAIAPPVDTQVTVFHDFSATKPASLSWAFAPPAAGDDTLEFRSYQALVAKQLDRLGLHRVPLKKADIAVLIRYRVDNGKEMITESPVYGQFSTGFWSHHDRFWYAPGFVVAGSQFNTYVLYTRVLQVDMVKASQLASGDPQRLFEGRVISEGEGAEINRVMPYLVEALFSDFPGANGKTRHLVCRRGDAGIQCRRDSEP